MVKTQSVSALKKKADAAWSKYIRYRDGEFKRGQWIVPCITCGDERPLAQMQCGHFVTRRTSTLRFDEQNTNAQCAPCNIWHSGEQYLYGIQLDYKYGDGTAAALHARRFETHKFTITELEEIINFANEQVKEFIDAGNSRG